MQDSEATLPRATSTLFTIGHSTRSIAEFVALLREAGVGLLIDVRAIPRSRTNPQFNADTLPQTLSGSGVLYRHLPALGGRRQRLKSAAPSPNSFWQVTAFRNYADYALSESFQEGLQQLQALARQHCCAIMCAEAVWWRCHRRIIADYLLSRGVAVMHIMGPGKIDPATPTPAACARADGTLVYPASSAGPAAAED